MIGAMLAKVDGFWERVYPVVEGSAPPGAGTGGVVDEIELNGRVFIRHTFTSAGEFTVTRAGLFTLFLVAGGGPGGNGTAVGYEAGGGGAGCVRWQELERDAGPYPVAVGAGGSPGGNGGASTALGMATQGGRRGNHGGGVAVATTNGSGGGGSHDRTVASGSTGTGVEFLYAHGGETPIASSSGGGGGGAGQAGGANGFGRGGDGIEFPPGSGVYYAGGGGAFSANANAVQAGGLGGGGAGGSVAAIPNTGGGGGGARGVSVLGGVGGSGIVMVCYERGPVLTPGDETLTLTWDETPGATYAVEMDGVIVERGQNSPYVVSGLVNGEEHTFRVRENLDGLWGAWSAPVTGAAAPFNNATGGTITEVADYNGTGETWRVHEFTASGDFTVLAASDPFSALVCGGGAGGGGSNNAQHGSGGGGGVASRTDRTLTPGVYPVVVGNGGGGGAPNGAPGGTGGVSSFDGVSHTSGPGGTSAGGGANGGTGGSNLTSTVTGASVLYGQDAPNFNSGQVTSQPGGGGRGAQNNTSTGAAGRAGRVVIAYRIG